MLGYSYGNTVYMIRHEDGSIETAPVHVPYNGERPDFDRWKTVVDNWNHELCEGFGVHGIDRWGYLYAHDLENKMYIVSPGQDRYQRIRVKGKFAGWYLNAYGQMCMITDNFGDDLGKKNIIRVYRVTPIMDEA